MIVVIGAGAAGYFAAIHAAAAGADVLILEKSQKVLSKVRISGGGRCNLTNAAVTADDLIAGYPRGSRELRGPFTRFNNHDTIAWFEKRGVALKSEQDGRVFPVSDDSASIVNCLLNEAEKAGIKIRFGSAIKAVMPNQDGFLLELENGLIQAEKLIITTGGSATVNGYSFLKYLDLKIIEPVPSLFTFNIPDSPFVGIMGVSVQDAQIRIEGTKLVTRGPLLFTHWGLSGPAVLRLSSLAARWLHEQQYLYKVLLNFVPGLSQDEVRQVILDEISCSKDKLALNSRLFGLSSRLWEILCGLAGIDSRRKWGEVSKQSLNKLLELISSFKLDASGKTTFKEEFVTCGGISLKEIDFRTMQSKKYPGLFFAGEVLDIDGITGGFNFQAAWTTGYLAGTSAAS